MQHFISMIDQYVYSEVIDKSWLILQDRLKDARRYSELVEAHEEYANRIIEKCLLSKSASKIHTQLTEMLKLIFSFQSAVLLHDENEILDESDFKKLRDIGTKFDKYLQTHSSYMAFIYKVMKKLASKTQFKSLVLTLDYNEYYSK